MLGHKIQYKNNSLAFKLVERSRNLRRRPFKTFAKTNMTGISKVRLSEKAFVMLLLASIVACQREDEVKLIKIGSLPEEEAPPEYVFVRTPEVKVVVQIDAQMTAHVGEWISISASRRSSGQWSKVRYSELDPNAPWLGVPPPAFEPEVAANLTWFTDPPRAAEFDSGFGSIPLGAKRQARFKAPGVYRLWATSHHPIDAKSNIVTINVE